MWYLSDERKLYFSLDVLDRKEVELRDHKIYFWWKKSLWENKEEKVFLSVSGGRRIVEEQGELLTAHHTQSLHINPNITHLI